MSLLLTSLHIWKICAQAFFIIAMHFLVIDWSFWQEIAKDFFVPLVGSIAGVGATLYVFFRQTAIQSLDVERKIRENNELQDNQATRNLTHFVWLLDDVLKFAATQNSDYLDTATKLEASPLEQHRFITRASGTLTRLLTLKQDDIFFSFVRKSLDTQENRNLIALVYSRIDLISQLLSSVKKKYRSHLNIYEGIATEYREVVESVRDLVIERTTNAKKSHSIGIDPLALYLAEVSRNYLAALNTLPEAGSIAWQHTNYLWPLQETLVKEFEHDERMTAIVNKGRRGLILIGRMRFEVVQLRWTV